MRPKGMQYLTTLLGAGVSKAPGLHESATATGNTGSRAQAAPSARTAAAARSASRAALAPPEEEDDLMEPFAVVPFEY